MLSHANNLIEFTENGSAIIKRFSLETKSSKERYQRELAFYQYCKKINFRHCPKLISFDSLNQTLTIKFIKGNKPKVGRLEDLENFCLFIATLNKGNTPSLPPAAETFSSIDGLFEQIRSRRASLDNKLFTDHIDIQNLDKMITDVSLILSRINVDCQTNIVNPSDLGLHNYLTHKTGHGFLDFEYAGIDCIPKLIYDFVLHPRNRFETLTLEEVFAKLAEVIPTKPIFQPELACVFSLWWMLRLLNSNIVNIKIRSGILTEITASTYIKERVANLKRFEKLYDDFKQTA